MRQWSVELVCLCLALLAVEPTSAFGAAKKDPPKDAELTKKEATKTPERDLAGDITRHKKEKAKERPALEYDQFRLGVELQVASKRHEQIDTLQKIMQLGAGQNEVPDLAFRLGELYWEESKYFFFEANRKDDDIIRAKVDKNEAKLAQSEAEKKDLAQKSEHYQSLAIDQYRTIIKKFPKYHRMDEVLFFLGHNMWEAGKEREAVAAYQKLVKDHAKSRYLPDAWLALGQHSFNNSKGHREGLSEALESFKKAASYTESKVYGYALYMQGWCYFNLNDFKSAMDMFKAVVYFGELQGKGDSRAMALSREARKDYVVAYSHYGDVMLAKNDFQKVGGDEHWWNMLKGLANLYYEDGKDKEATIIYNQMIKDRPLSPEAPFFQGRIVDCVIRVGNKKITVSQVRELVRIINEVGKASMAKEEEKKSYQDARELAERIMSNLAVNWHNEAKKTRDETVFILAADVYQDYLSVFADNAKAYDLRFYYAELLNDNLNKYDRAAEEYTRVFLQDIQKIDPPKNKDGTTPKPQKPGRWMVDAAFNSVLAYDEVAKKSEKDEQAPKGAKDCKTKLPIPAPKKNLVTACERYIKYISHGEKKVEVMYKAATIYYRYSDFEKAVPLFAQIALDYPDAEVAEYSGNLVLDSFNCQEDWQKIGEWARKFLAQPKLAKGKFKDDLAKYLEQSAFKLVNIAEGKQDFVGAAEAYLSFVNEFPKSDLADLALFNASVDFFKGKQVDRSIEVRQLLVERYPHSRRLPECIYANGESFETIGDFEEAAASYEKYAFAWADHAQKNKKGAVARKPKSTNGKAEEAPAAFEEGKAQVALYNAGIFREGLTQYNEALRDRTRYIELWPSAKDSEAISLSIAELMHKMGRSQKAMNHIEEYQKKYGNDPDKLLAAELRIARIYEKQGRNRDAQRIYSRINDYYTKKMYRSQRSKLGAAAVEAVAKATYVGLEPDFVAYTRMSLPTDERRLKSALENKQKALLELQKKYTEVVNLKAAEPAICSLYKIGLLYHNLAKDFTNAAVPEMPFPKQLQQIQHLWNVPYNRWPKVYRDAISQADLENIKKQYEDAKQQFDQAYRDQLMRYAAPVEEKAADALASTVEKARELAIFNECSDKALELLTEKYKPMQYPKMVEKPVEIKNLTGMRVGNLLLAAVQPIPPPVKVKQPARQEPPPDLSKIGNGPKPTARPAANSDQQANDNSSIEAPPSGEGKAKPASHSKTAPVSEPRPLTTEPDDPDLLK